jgi:hypothetical protein
LEIVVDDKSIELEHDNLGPDFSVSHDGWFFLKGPRKDKGKYPIHDVDVIIREAYTGKHVISANDQEKIFCNNPEEYYRLKPGAYTLDIVIESRFQPHILQDYVDYRTIISDRYDFEVSQPMYEKPTEQKPKEEIPHEEEKAAPKTKEPETKKPIIKPEQEEHLEELVHKAEFGKRNDSLGFNIGWYKEFLTLGEIEEPYLEGYIVEAKGKWYPADIFKLYGDAFINHGRFLIADGEFDQWGLTIGAEVLKEVSILRNKDDRLLLTATPGVGALIEYVDTDINQYDVVESEINETIASVYGRLALNTKFFNITGIYGQSIWGRGDETTKILPDPCEPDPCPEPEDPAYDITKKFWSVNPEFHIVLKENDPTHALNDRQLKAGYIYGYEDIDATLAGVPRDKNITKHTLYVNVPLNQNLAITGSAEFMKMSGSANETRAQQFNICGEYLF